MFLKNEDQEWLTFYKIRSASDFETTYFCFTNFCFGFIASLQYVYRVHVLKLPKLFTYLFLQSISNRFDGNEMDLSDERLV